MTYVAARKKLSRNRCLAYCEPAEQAELLAAAAPESDDKQPRLTVAELKKEVGRRKLEVEAEKHPLPDGRYRVLYADPPWKYADELIEGYGAAEQDGKFAKRNQPCAASLAWTSRMMLSI